jgi:hypothetical protein
VDPVSRNSFEPTFVFGIKGYSVYTGSITKDFLYCLVYGGFGLDRLHCATKSCPQEATPIVSPFFQNRRDGLVREGLLYIYQLNVMFCILKKISAKSKTDDIFTIAYAYKFYQENIFYWKIHPILDQYC